MLLMFIFGIWFSFTVDSYNMSCALSLRRRTERMYICTDENIKYNCPGLAQSSRDI
jgi:hypothetical protein